MSALEQAAQNLAEAAKLKHEMTGELANSAVWSLGQEIRLLRPSRTPPAVEVMVPPMVESVMPVTLR